MELANYFHVTATAKSAYRNANGKLVVAEQLGDALGYEERRGTVRRVARGTYVIGTLTPYRRRVVQSLETPTASKRLQL